MISMIDCDNVRDLLGPDTQQARKTSLTEVFGLTRFAQPAEILTTDGLVRVEPGWYYVALDVNGNPYPIEKTVFEKTYEIVPG